MRKNVILSDMPLDENWEFRQGLEDITKESWCIKNCVSNQGRSFWYNIYRYLVYFYFPFTIFLKRNKYDKIVSWQSFHGVLFAFYCNLFKVRKTNYLIIKNFTYKPKGEGMLGKFYYKWMRSIVKSPYIDKFICTSQTFCDYCAEQFDEPIERFIYLPFGVEDFTKLFSKEELSTHSDYILSLGRSNRDWNWLIDCFAGTKYKLKIICDQLHKTELPENIEILNNVWFKDSYRYIANSKLSIIPILDGKIGSGETVLLQTMSFGKPIIINRPSCLADDYIDDGINGIIVNKSKEELLNAIHRLYNDDKLYTTLSMNARQKYESEHSIFKYGQRIADIIIKDNEK